MDTWGASGSFAKVNERDDESVIKSRPQCPELPDPPQAQNENSIQFSSLYEYLSSSSFIAIHTKLSFRGYCYSMWTAYQQGK